MWAGHGAVFFGVWRFEDCRWGVLQRVLVAVLLLFQLLFGQLKFLGPLHFYVGHHILFRLFGPFLPGLVTARYPGSVWLLLGRLQFLAAEPQLFLLVLPFQLVHAEP